MNKCLIICLLGAAMIGCLVPSATAQQKIGAVDMKRIYVGYDRSKQLDELLAEKRAVSARELAQRAAANQAILAEIRQLDVDLASSGLSHAERKSKLAARQEKSNALKAMELELQEFKLVSEKQLEELALQMRTDIVDEINSVVTAYIRNAKFDVVFDATPRPPNYSGSKDAYDFTQEVIDTLNLPDRNREAVVKTATKPTVEANTGSTGKFNFNIGYQF